MDLEDLLLYCFQYFYNKDRANAAIHLNFVRYSPITFRLAEGIREVRKEAGQPMPSSSVLSEVWAVLVDKDLYVEDPGRQ